MSQQLPHHPSRALPLQTWKLFLGLVLAGVLLALAYLSDGGQSEGHWFSVIPPLLAILLAFITQRIVGSLLLSVICGGFLVSFSQRGLGLGAMGGGISNSTQVLVGTVTDPINLQILGFVVLILAFISVLIASGGLKALVLSLQVYAKDRQSSQLMTAFLGLLIFIDDYANTMIVGSTMRHLTDQYKVSREKLAFLVDATSAPVAGLAFVSTWVGYEVGLFSDLSTQLNLGLDGYGIFFQILNYRFYCILTLVFVFCIAWSEWDFGPMDKAEKHALQNHSVSVERHDSAMNKGFKPIEVEDGVRMSIWTGIIPIAILLSGVFGGLWIDGGGLSYGALGIFSFYNWRDAIAGAENGILVLALAALVAWLISIVLARSLAGLSGAQILRASTAGLKTSILPLSILILAWCLKGVSDQLHTGTFLASVLGQSIPAFVFPLVVFLTAAVTAFATGTSWGTMAILIPTLAPVAFVMDGEVFGLITALVLAAVLDGAIMGDHCSPISDTTIMSSIASSCDHMAHVRTQLPYSLVVALLAGIFGYLPVALGMNSWLMLVVVVIFMIGFFAMKRWQQKSTALPLGASD